MSENSLRITSLRTMLLLLFVVPLFIAVGLTSYVSYLHSMDTVDEMAGQLCSEIMSRVEQHLDSYLETAQSINLTNVDLAHQNLLDITDTRKLSHYFWEQGRIFKGLGTIGYAGSDGSFTGANEPENYIVIADRELTGGSIRRYAPTADGDISDTILAEKKNYDARQRGWFKNAVAAARPIWTEINPSVTGARLDLTATAPLYDSRGILKGVFLTDVSLSNLSDFLQSLRIGKTGQAFIIESDWSIVATSYAETPFIILDKTEKRVRRMQAAESKSLLVSAAAEYLLQEGINLADIAQRKLLAVKIRDTKYFLQLSPYSRHDLNFLTVIVLPEADFMSHVNTSKNISILLMCLAVVIAVVLGAWMSNWVTRPIRKLSASAKALERGELDQRVVIERNDEVGDLAKMFNSMADNLSRTIEKLREENMEREKAETAIRQALDIAEDEREKNKAIIAAIGDGISIQDTDFKVLYQNSIHREMVGEHEGEYCYVGYEKKDAVCEGCPVAKSFDDGGIHNTDRSVPSPDGTKYFEITTSPLRDSTGKIVAGIEVVRDVTSRRRAELVLAEEKERLAVTLRCIADGVITINLEGEVIFVNRVAEELTGWEQYDAVGRPLGEVFRIADKKTGAHLCGLLESALARGETINLPVSTVLTARDGTEKLIADSAAPIRDEDSQPRGLVIVFRDVTHEVRTEQELLKVRKLESVGILAGGIAHDFNNILVAILGNLNLATQMLDKQHEAAPILNDAVKASLRAKDLTNQLLTFAKGGNPVKELASIAEVIEDSAQFVLHGAKTKCVFDFADDLWLVDIDKGQISQVIQNIIINSQHAMPEGGTINVSCENVTDSSREHAPLDPEKKFIRIAITDTGIGIQETLLEKIFDPYFTTKSEGSGLGLAISHSIIEKHNGHIIAWSQPGKGTTFYIYLPAAPGKNLVVESHGDDGPLREHGGMKILLMDDDEMVRRVSGNMLKFMGYQVGHAEDGLQAINLYRTDYEAGQPFDVVIMDLTIPGGMGGQEAVQELHRIDPDAKVIVSSGYSNDPILAEYEKYGFEAAIVKPFDMKELSSVIRQSINQEDTVK
jgi:PAS domain S-box-containing protein